MSFLEVNNLKVEFDTADGVVSAVNNVSFSLDAGKFLAIVGESGSGKSQTVFAMNGLLDHNGRASGSVKFEGKEILNLPSRELNLIRAQKIAMIFQDPMTSLNPYVRVSEQMAEVLVHHKGIPKSDAIQQSINMLDAVKIPDAKNRIMMYPHEFSGGMRQRVMIAMSLLCHPKLLIADEPTTALDVTVQKTILQLMQNLQKEHDMGIMFITHDLGVIAELADKVVVMYKGNIVEQGSVWDIFTNPKHPYTKGLLACRPPLDKRYTFLPTVSDFMKIDENGEIIDNGISVSEFTKDLAIPESERVAKHKKLYDQKPLMQIKNLKTYFPIRNGFFGGISDHVKAVDNVAFDVYPGETLGLVGESGCGKTTIGRTIIRLEEPTEGEMIYKGKDIAKMNTEELRLFRKDVQIIFQDPYSSLNPRMTIGNAIMEPMQVHGILENDEQRKKKVEELLTRVSLDPTHFYRYPHEFSGGQRQRIGIARALAVNPKFIICDESVSALDVSVQAQVLNLLNELKEEFGLSYIFISHDLSVVKYMSDRMAVMQEGKIVEMGDADQIYNKPATEYTKKLIDAIPEGKLEDIKKHLESKGIKVN